MRKNLIALLGFLSGVATYYIKSPTQLPKVGQYHNEESVKVAMAAPRTEVRARALIRVVVPQVDPDQEKLQDLPGLPRGMRYAPRVKAVSAESYRPEMGESLLIKNGFVFIRSEAPMETNVVFDRRLRTFHPLTATIKILEVSEDERDELLKEWEEYYFNKELGIQYLQSTHASLFSDYRKLKKAGHKVHLEVIQAVYQTR